jgi:hypothetical protein
MLNMFSFISLSFLNCKWNKEKFLVWIVVYLIILSFKVLIIFYLYVFKKFILYENGNNFKFNLKNGHLDKKDIKVCVCTVGKQENKYW